MIYASKGTPFEKLEIKLENSKIEVCAITIYLKTEKINLMNCYDPPVPTPTEHQPQ